ncbi:conserved hypothetical protein [Acidobacteriia bacterium SbA2]|nr:conserved hypothetical protein [Acidobacteriia bacterium SbA2]
MLKFLIDENLDQRILRGLQLNVPGIEFAIVQETPLAGAQDGTLVEWATQNGYVIVTHDRRTMLKIVHERLRAAKETAGIVIVRSGFPLSAIIEDMVMLVKCSSERELQNQVVFIPLG